LHPNRSQYIPPCDPRRSLVLSCPSLLAPAFFWLVVVCAVCPLAAAQGHDVFYSFIFLSINLTAKATPRLSPARSSPVARPPKRPPHRQSRLNLIVVCICWDGSHLRPRPHPSLSLSLFCPNRRPKRQERIPPTRSARPHLLPNIHSVRLVVTSSYQMAAI
jgi:hypothetical protein